MEYTQWDSKNIFDNSKGLNPCCNGIYSMSIILCLNQNFLWVLILVVMEYTQWAPAKNILMVDKNGLNPCCNGIYSMRITPDVPVFNGLNPCCNGIYSMSLYLSFGIGLCHTLVLILVVMEYTQWEKPPPPNGLPLS